MLGERIVCSARCRGKLSRFVLRKRMERLCGLVGRSLWACVKRGIRRFLMVAVRVMLGARHMEVASRVCCSETTLGSLRRGVWPPEPCHGVHDKWFAGEATRGWLWWRFAVESPVLSVRGRMCFPGTGIQACLGSWILALSARSPRTSETAAMLSSYQPGQ